MYATGVISRTGINRAPPTQWGQFATNVRVNSEPGSREIVAGAAQAMKMALEVWSKLIFPRGNLYRTQFKVATKDSFSSATNVSQDSVDTGHQLMSFLSLDEIDRTQNKVALDAAAQEGLKPLLVVSELLKCSKARPDAYTLKTGEMTLDYNFDHSRVSCVFNNNYCHVMYFENDDIKDKYFEGDNYDISSIRDYVIDLLKRVYPR